MKERMKTELRDCTVGNGIVLSTLELDSNSPNVRERKSERVKKSYNNEKRRNDRKKRREEHGNIEENSEENVNCTEGDSADSDNLLDFMNKFKGLAKRLANDVAEMSQFLDKAGDMFIGNDLSVQMNNLIENIWSKYRISKEDTDKGAGTSSRLLSQEYFNEPDFLAELESLCALYDRVSDTEKSTKKRKGEDGVPDKVTASEKSTKKRKGDDAVPSFDLLCTSLEAEEGIENADGFDKAADIVDPCADNNKEKSCGGLDDSFEDPFGGEVNNIICDEQVDKDKDKSCGFEDVDAVVDVIPTSPAVKDGVADKDKISSAAVEDGDGDVDKDKSSSLAEEDADVDAGIIKVDEITNDDDGDEVVQIDDDAVDLESIPEDLPEELEEFCSWFNANIRNGKIVWSNFGEHVFGCQVTAAILRKDVCALVDMDEIGSSTIIFYMAYLYDQLKEMGKEKVICMVDPNRTCNLIFKSDKQRSLLLRKRFDMCGGEAMLFIPQNTDRHWTLTVVDLKNKVVNYIDPVKNHLLSTRDSWSIVVNK